MVRSLARLQFFQNSNHVRLFQLMTVDNDSPIVYTKYTNKSKMLLKNSSFDFFFHFWIFFLFFFYFFFEKFYFSKNCFGKFFAIIPYRQIPETISKKRAVTQGISRKLFPGKFHEYLPMKKYFFPKTGHDSEAFPETFSRYWKFSWVITRIYEISNFI